MSALPPPPPPPPPTPQKASGCAIGCFLISIALFLASIAGSLYWLRSAGLL